MHPNDLPAGIDTPMAVFYALLLTRLETLEADIPLTQERLGTRVQSLETLLYGPQATALISVAREVERRLTVLEAWRPQAEAEMRAADRSVVEGTSRVQVALIVALTSVMTLLGTAV